MTRMLKRFAAWILVLTLAVSQLALPVMAQSTEVPSAPGGGNENVQVQITVTPNADGTVTTQTATDTAGAATDSGNTVVFSSEKITDSENNVLFEDTDYTVTNTAGTYTAQGGTETSQTTAAPGEVEQVLEGTLNQETLEQVQQELEAGLEEKVTAELITDGTVNGEVTQTTTVPEITVTTGDTKAEDPAEYDQTTVTLEAERTVTAQVENVEVTTPASKPVFVDTAGNVVQVDELESKNWYWEYAYYNTDNECTERDGVVQPGFGAYDWDISLDIPVKGGNAKPAFYAVKMDENNNPISERSIRNDGVSQRAVYDNNGTPDDPSDDFKIQGLYCADASTGNQEGYAYKMVNLEDAVEQNYYDENEAAHLRAIMNNGYTWDDDSDNGMTNLANIKAMLTQANQKAKEAGDAATMELLARIDIGNLTREQAATATQMGVWHYGNRIALEEGEVLQVRSKDPSTQALYEYLITLREEAPEDETQVISQDKFVDNLKIGVGGAVDGAAENADADLTNDVFHVDVRFSLVVVPDPVNDNLLVSVLDENNVPLRTVRIAGTNEAGQDFETARTEQGLDGKTYYVIDGLQLSENQDASFNLRLDGQQMLEEGVYVFESEQRSIAQAYEITYAEWTSEENWDNEVDWMLNRLSAKQKALLPENYKEVLKAAYENDPDQGRKYYRDILCKKLYFNKYLNEDGTFQEAYLSSQNCIGKFKGTADVSVNLKMDINFNVDENTVITTTREWREERIITGGGTDPQTPGGGERLPGTEVRTRIAPRDGALLLWSEDLTEGLTETIVDEEVPLAVAPQTGDASQLMAVISLMSLSGAYLLSRKNRAI